MTGLPVPDAGTDPTGFVLAVADLRERRAKAATPGPWRVTTDGDPCGPDIALVHDDLDDEDSESDIVARFVETWDAAEHIAAEASPAHALAEVALWRRLAERHQSEGLDADSDGEFWRDCYCGLPWTDPARTDLGCLDLLAALAAARAYLGEPM